MKRSTKVLISMVPVTALCLWLDALEPGQGVFYNPMFWARSQYSKLANRDWQVSTPLDLASPLMSQCEKLTSQNTIREVQIEARQIITGKSESFALAQLGTPTCALGDGVYRWVSESGLALDVTFQDGEVRGVDLNR